MSDDSWRKCSACKNPIAYDATYFTCSVSTCNRKRTALQFCTVSCWEVHLPVARHRESWADEQTAPSRAEAARAARAAAATPEPRKPRRILPESKPAAATDSAAPGQAPKEIRIVGTRLKDYVRAISGFNTSDRALEPLSEIVREAAGEAVRNARAEGRKTVLDRDVDPDRKR
ncbi:MAG: hypothetical protein VX466_12745 [Myxococcota bacterium]|nr:hypothetical protein [Myxococcota bacterium]